MTLFFLHHVIRFAKSHAVKNVTDIKVDGAPMMARHSVIATLNDPYESHKALILCICTTYARAILFLTSLPIQYTAERSGFKQHLSAEAFCIQRASGGQLPGSMLKRQNWLAR
jgi:hypothetical protein